MAPVARRAAVALLFGLTRPLVTRAAHTVFRRILTLHGERFPREGPVLLVANHPAAWTDAVVLDVALGRKLHFVVLEQLFRPWWRALVLRFFGSLPVHVATETDPTANLQTFDQCRALLRRGDVVAFFPEGVSLGDRTLEPLRPGAARLALETVAAGQRMSLIPVALHYGDRAAFRSEVRVVVGSPMALSETSIGDGADREPVERLPNLLTARLAGRLQELLDEGDHHARETAAPRPHFAAAAIVEVVGLIGTIVHAIPAMLIEGAARRFVPAPQQVMLARIVGVLVLVPLWYLALLLLLIAAGLPGVLVIAAPVLGWVACVRYDHHSSARGAPAP